MSQTALPVRTTDPDTSYEAAMKAVAHASKYRPLLLEIITEHGPITFDEIIGHYNMRRVMDESVPGASDSGIRTRVKELQRMGLVRIDPEKGVSSHGNRARRWVVVSEDEFLPTYASPAQTTLDEEIVRFQEQTAGSSDAADADASSEEA